jgi:hypothetical protein
MIKFKNNTKIIQILQSFYIIMEPHHISLTIADYLTKCIIYRSNTYTCDVVVLFFDMIRVLLPDHQYSKINLNVLHSE